MRHTVKHIIMLEYPMNLLAYIFDSYDNTLDIENSNKLVDKLIPFLNDKEKLIVDLTFNKRISLVEQQNITGMTKQEICQAKRRACNKMKNQVIMDYALSNSNNVHDYIMFKGIDVSILLLGLSTKTINSLICGSIKGSIDRYPINTIRDLVMYLKSGRSVLDIRNFGEKSLNEVKDNKYINLFIDSELIYRL